MSRATIYFASGKTVEIDDWEFGKLPHKLHMRGVKTMVTRTGILIPVNSHTIECIVPIKEEPPAQDEPRKEPVDENPTTVPDMEYPSHKKEKEKPVPVPEKNEEEELKEIAKAAEACKQEVEDMKDIEEKREDAEALFMAKANCKHVNHTIYVQQTNAGPRYFPVCSFCGRREKYVKLASLTEEQIANAEVWKG